MNNYMTQLQANLIDNIMHHLENIMVRTKDPDIMSEVVKTTENLSKLIDTFPDKIL